MKEKKQTVINVYLTFNGNCGEAMEFYRECFGGTLTIQRVVDSPMSSQWPAAAQQSVLHAELRQGSLVLMGSDMAATPRRSSGNAISLALHCKTHKEIETYFKKLSMGGKVTHPLHRFFDGTIAALSDRYGMNWVLKH
jgi:PhnB protein